MNLDKDHVTLYLALWGALGPLVGILVGHYLTRSWQQKQWILDRRKEEFRELISAIQKATIEQMYYVKSLNTSSPTPAEPFMDAYKAAFQMMLDRIYIADDIEKLKVVDVFIAYGDTLRDGSDMIEAGRQLDEVVQSMVKIARRG